MKQADISVELKGYYGSDLDVVNAARVSFDKESDYEYEYLNHDNTPARSPEMAAIINKRLSKKDCGLISYLAKHKHHSPFNHCFLSFRVKAPIFVARQLVKHKFLPWNEVSRRYVDEEPEFYFPEYWRKKADNVKQGSSDLEVEMDENDPYGIESTVEGCLNYYRYLLDIGTCPEQARMLLPQNMMTTWIWSGTLGAFLDMLKLRLDSHTQYESRIVAEKIHEIVKSLFPISTTCYLESI